MAHSSDDEYFLPLQDQRVFGAGIKRKRIAFIPASSSEPTLPVVDSAKQPDIADRYLSIVLPKSKTTSDTELKDTKDEVAAADVVPSNICPICKQVVSDTNSAVASKHESSIAHQVCLEHSHPPSHLDRSHVGLKYLSEYGWDPNSRKGLGVRQDGIRVPIKAKEKHDTSGLQERLDDDDVDRTKTKKPAVKTQKPVSEKLNAKETRKRHVEAQKRADKMRAAFYGQDLEQYLGPGG